MRQARPHRARIVAALVLPAMVAASPSGAVEIRSDGVLEIDGEPFFPLGLLSNGNKVYTEDWHRRIRDSQANFVWDIEVAYADTAIGCEAFVDSAAAAGYKLMIGAGDTFLWDDPDTPELEVDQLMYELDEIPPLLECRDHVPGTVVAWANRDEPSWTISRGVVGDIDSAHVMWTYDQLRAMDPDGIVATNFAAVHLSEDLEEWKSDITGYLPATDVAMLAAYPYPAGPGTCSPRHVVGWPDCTMDRLCVGADIFLSELNRPGQPLWIIIQAFKDIPYREMKWEAAAAIVHGATGVLWGGWTWWHPLGHGLHNWPVTVEVMNEIVPLHDWLVGRDLPVTSDDPDVEVRAKQGPDGSVLVIAISRNGYTGVAKVALGAPTKAAAEVVGEDRTVRIAGGRFVDHFDAYEAHFYLVDLELGQGHDTGGGGGDAVDAPEVTAAPQRFRVRAYPNPSSGRTVTEIRLPDAAAVLLTVHDAAGRRVALAGQGSFGPGVSRVVWNGRDFSGAPVAPGVYFVRGTTSSGETATARVLIRR